jgi:DNA-binding phage protein
MTTTIAPDPPKVEAPTALDQCLAETRAVVDRVLDTLPERRLEARRTITRELEIDPGAEELQTIERIAHAEAGKGEQRELSRLALTARIVADREIRELLDASQLDVTRMSRSAELMPGLLHTVTELENEVRNRADSLRDAEQDFLLQVGHSLVPAAEPLIAATVLAPRLLLFVRAAAQDDPRSCVPTLAETDVALIRAATHGELADDASRFSINALALRTLIEEDLVAWETGAPEAEPRSLILERMNRQKVAYHIISNRLQQQQDTALVAGLDGFAEQLRSVKHQLFSVYLKLAAVLNDPTGSAAAGTKTVEETRAELDRLLQECSAAEALAEVARTKHVSRDELYLRALKGMGAPSAPETRRDFTAIDLKRERLRVRVLASLTGVLLVAFAAVYWLIPRAPAVEPRVATTELPAALSVIDAVAVGPMMYAQVSRWTWDDMTAAEQLSHVKVLAAAVQERGFRTLYITDDEHRDLATWSRDSGVKLVNPEPEAAPGS